MNKYSCKSKIFELKNSPVHYDIEPGYLIPIGFDYRTRLPDCVKLLTRWRIENPSLSPARFPVSEERTEKWLRKSILDNEFRVMFMIKNSENKSVGHIGLSQMDFLRSSVRIDSVMKGVKNESPGIMQRAIEYLKDWCRDILEADYADLVVLNDNVRAINLYHRCGFIDDRLIPLKRVDDNEEINWIEDESIVDPEKSYLHMVCALL